MKKYHKKKGGYSSASDYVMKLFGNENTQYDNALKVQPGANLASQQSNTLNLIKDPNSSQSPIIVGPQLKNGGKKHKKHTTKSNSF